MTFKYNKIFPRKIFQKGYKINFQKILFIIFIFLYVENNLSKGEEIKNINPTIFNEDDNNKEVHLNIDNFFTIKLKTQLGTGYDWYLMKIPKNMTLVKEFIEEEFQKREKTKIGTNNFHCFQFKILNKGESFLKLYYKRIWEKSTKESKTFQLYVNTSK